MILISRDEGKGNALFAHAMVIRLALVVQTPRVVDEDGVALLGDVLAVAGDEGLLGDAH